MSMTRRRFLGGLAAGAATPLFAACQMTPGTGERDFNIVGPSGESRMGMDDHYGLLAKFGGAYDNPRLQSYVKEIGLKLAAQCETPDAPFRFTVLNSPAIKSTALPGGYVYVTRGLLALLTNEAELACVLGHEIGHVTARHASRRYSRSVAVDIGALILETVIGLPGVSELVKWGGSGWLDSFQKEGELQSDFLAVAYVRSAGWDASAMMTMLYQQWAHAKLKAEMAGKSAEDDNGVDTPAFDPTFVARLYAAANRSSDRDATGELNEDAFLDHADGMIWGDSQAEGVIRGRTFQHPGLALSFRVPSGFRLHFAEDGTVATDGRGGIIRFIPGKIEPQDGLPDWKRVKVRGMAAVSKILTMDDLPGKDHIRMLEVRIDDDTRGRFLFVTPKERKRDGERTFRAVARTIRKLTPRQCKAVAPLRIKVVRVRRRDRAKSLASRMAVPGYALEWFHLLNRLPPDLDPPVGKRVRLIV